MKQFSDAVQPTDSSERAAVAEILKKMIAFSEGNLHDINHLLKVWSYAKTIGELEKLDAETQYTLEVAAILHDIACPLCREKYGNTNGKHQEEESAPLVTEFLRDCGVPDAQTARIVYIVSHHHTYTNVDGMDYQILLEADYLVNADESGYSPEAITSFQNRVFKTAVGTSLLKALYLRHP